MFGFGTCRYVDCNNENFVIKRSYTLDSDECVIFDDEGIQDEFEDSGIINVDNEGCFYNEIEMQIYNGNKDNPVLAKVLPNSTKEELFMEKAQYILSDIDESNIDVEKFFIRRYKQLYPEDFVKRSATFGDLWYSLNHKGIRVTLGELDKTISNLFKLFENFPEIVDDLHTQNIGYSNRMVVVDYATYGAY